MAELTQEPGLRLDIDPASSPSRPDPWEGFDLAQLCNHLKLTEAERTHPWDPVAAQLNEEPFINCQPSLLPLGAFESPQDRKDRLFNIILKDLQKEPAPKLATRTQSANKAMAAQSPLSINTPTNSKTNVPQFLPKRDTPKSSQEQSNTKRQKSIDPSPRDKAKDRDADRDRERKKSAHSTLHRLVSTGHRHSWQRNKDELWSRLKHSSQSRETTGSSQTSSKSSSFFTKYNIGRTLGEGSNAVVKLLSPHSGYHLPQLALKLFKEKDHWPTAKTEGRILADLCHHNIIRLERLCKREEKFYLVLEYFDGPNLAEILRKKKGQGLDEKVVSTILRQVAEALAHCHDRGISHLDVKPENLLVDCDWNVKLIDFAFSVKLADSAKLKRYCGTPGYMAPEILKRESYYPNKADVWSLGVVGYRLLTGKPPFKGIEYLIRQKGS